MKGSAPEVFGFIYLVLMLVTWGYFIAWGLSSGPNTTLLAVVLGWFASAFWPIWAVTALWLHFWF